MTKKDLKRPSLTSNIKLAQSGKHESVHTRGPSVLESHVQSPREVPFVYTEIILLFLTQAIQK